MTVLETAENQAYDIVTEEAYEQALEDGMIYYLPATSTDPSCPNEYVDVVLKNFRDDSDEGTADYFTARAIATVGKSVVFERDYWFYINKDGKLRIDYGEDV